MTTTIVFADSSDGDLTSSNNSYATALAGSGVTADDSGTGLILGQERDGSTYRVYQAGIAYDYTAPSDRSPAAAYFRLDQAQVTGTGVARSIDIALYNWATSYGVSDWRTPAQLASLTSTALASRIDNAHAAGVGRLRAGLERMGQLDSSGVKRVVLYTSRNRAQSAPGSGSSEYHVLRSTETSGTSQDPALFIAETTRHIADVCLSGQVQLSDGTHAYLLQTATSPDIVNLSIVHHNGTSSVVVHTAPISAGRGGGAQLYTLAADDSDNLYVINGNPDTPGILRCRGFVKGSGHSWSAQPVRNASLPSYTGDVNNVAAAWHTPGAGGTILAVVARQPGRNSGTQIAYALLNCQYLLTGSGSLLRGSGDAEGILVANPGSDGVHNYVNETGTLLDVAAAPSSRRGFVTCTTKAQALGDSGAQSFARYELNGSGTGFASTARLRDTSGAFSSKDADAKSRVLPIDDSQFVSVNADSATGRGVTVVHRQSIGTGAINELSRVLLEAEGLTAMPDPAVLAISPAWDAVYNPVDNRVWVYYFDTADGQRLMRTSVNLTTGQAGQDEEEVDDAVGASGSTNHAIRVHRGATDGAQILVTVANETSGGTDAMLEVVDLLNSLPTQPIITVRANFDADNNAVFAWTFTDPDPGDAQSAYQVEIYDQATGTLQHDSTKTTSGTESYTLTGGTIANTDSYRWRVRCWDGDDEESPWSEFGTFATSDSGSVTITAPASDNDPTIITADYTVEWEVADTTQADYRVVVRRTDTLALLVDTGWVASSDTSYLVEGMEAGVEYRVQVTVRDALEVQSNTAERLITPDYASPETPLISVEAFDDDGYVLVTVVNPEPQGDRPNPDSNEIFRRRADSGGAWLLLAEIDPDGTHRDYTAPSGTAVEYMARAGVNA